MIKKLLFWLGGTIVGFSDLILRPRRVSTDREFRMGIEFGRFDEDTYNNTEKKRFMIRSNYGYDLSCELLKSGKPGNKIAILCHGFSRGKYKSLLYANVFLDLGYNVLIYDHRNHGLSGRAHTSMGYYEKYDLKKIIDWCCRTYGSECKIVTHGESMGASTVLMHLGIDDRVVCAIADCAYSDLIELLKHQIKHYYHLPQVLIPLESLITYLRAGFWYGEVSPIQVVSRTDTPILFIHGKKDNYVPTKMSKDMYERKRKRKAIYLVAGAGHATSYETNRIGYKKVVESFLIKYM